MSFLGLEIDQKMLDFNGVDDRHIGQYRNEFSPELKNYAVDRYGHLLKQWGYTV